MKTIKVKIDEDVSFGVGKKIAEAIAEYNNAEIKAWWDCCDGEHYPEFDEPVSSDIVDLANAWDKILEKLGVKTQIEINTQYIFYI